MDGEWRDLLQLGFSFAVAGYLLVWGQRTLHEIVKALAVQTELLRQVHEALSRMGSRGEGSRGT